jgi:hypothetical protein
MWCVIIAGCNIIWWLRALVVWVTVEARCAQSESIRAPQQVTAIVGTLLPSSVYYNAPLVFLAG